MSLRKLARAHRLMAEAHRLAAEALDEEDSPEASSDTEDLALPISDIERANARKKLRRLGLGV